MKIVHVMHHSLPGSDGYAIRAKYLLEAQVALGHKVTVLTSPGQGVGATDAVLHGITYLRSHYAEWEQRGVPNPAKHLVIGRAIRRRLTRLLDETPHDIVQGHTPFTVALPAMQEAGRRRIPFVYEKRNLWEESARARGKAIGRWPWFQAAQAADRWVTMQSDAVCTITQALRDRTIAKGIPAERVFVVGNGVDVAAFTPRPASAELRARCAPGGGLVIGFIGSFFAYEGLPMLVAAMAALHPQYPQARLVLVGDGEDTPRLASLVREHGLQGVVCLTGRVPHDQVLEYYAIMDALVYPRLRSALTDLISPLKPLESMAMARCIIGSDAGGIRELIRDGETGLVFEAQSQSALEAKLELLLSGQLDAGALGERARSQVVAQRQWRHMAMAYEAAYRQAALRLAPGAEGRPG